MNTRLLRALEALEAWLRSSGHPGVAGLRPGVPEAEVREQLGALGLDPPDDVLTFFGWHNGYEQAPRDDGHWYGRITPSWFPLTLDEACKRFLELREMFELEEQHGEMVGTHWFPLLQADAYCVLVDCRPEQEHRGRIAVSDWITELWPSPDLRPRSLAEPVEEWLSLLNDGLWHWDRSDDRWVDRRDPQTTLAPGVWNRRPWL